MKGHVAHDDQVACIFETPPGYHAHTHWDSDRKEYVALILLISNVFVIAMPNRIHVFDAYHNWNTLSNAINVFERLHGAYHVRIAQKMSLHALLNPRRTEVIFERVETRNQD